jgi:hypothetical protein
MANGTKRIGGRLVRGLIESPKETPKFRRPISKVAEQVARSRITSDFVSPPGTSAADILRRARVPLAIGGAGGITVAALRNMLGGREASTPSDIDAITGATPTQLPVQSTQTTAMAGQAPRGIPQQAVLPGLQLGQPNLEPVFIEPSFTEVGQVPQPQTQPPKQGFDYQALGGLLGQIAQSVSPLQGSLGYQLGGIGTQAAQAALYNRYLGQLISGQGQPGAPGLPQVSPLASFTLTPELQRQAQAEFEAARSGDVERISRLGQLTGIETPEQRLNRELIVQALQGQQAESVARLRAQQAQAEGKAISPAEQTRIYQAADDDAFRRAMQVLSLRYPEAFTKDPNTGETNLSFIPPGSTLQRDLFDEYIKQVQGFQSQGILPKGWERSAQERLQGMLEGLGISGPGGTGGKFKFVKPPKK